MGRVRAGSLSRKKRGPAALTLIEMIITSSLLGLILLFLFNIYPNSVMAIKHGEHRLKAACVAQSMLEQKMSYPFYDIDTIPDLSKIEGEDGTIYALCYETSNIPDTNSQMLRRIKVTVTWEERMGRYSLFKECDVCDIRR